MSFALETGNPFSMMSERTVHVLDLYYCSTQSCQIAPIAHVNSYLPCDREFATMKRKIRRNDRAYLPQEYEDMIKTSRTNSRLFSVKPITHEDIINFKDWWPKIYKKQSKSVISKQTFNVSECRMFVYDSGLPRYVKTYTYIDGLCSNTFKMVKNRAKQTLPTDRAYTESVTIDEKKIHDIAKLIRYVPNEATSFYNEIMHWKTASGILINRPFFHV